jgi:hypothetical protein
LPVVVPNARRRAVQSRAPAAPRPAAPPLVPSRSRRASTQGSSSGRPHEPDRDRRANTHRRYGTRSSCLRPPARPRDRQPHTPGTAPQVSRAPPRSARSTHASDCAPRSFAATRRRRYGRRTHCERPPREGRSALPDAGAHRACSGRATKGGTPWDEPR